MGDFEVNSPCHKARNQDAVSLRVGAPDLYFEGSKIIDADIGEWRFASFDTLEWEIGHLLDARRGKLLAAWQTLANHLLYS